MPTSLNLFLEPLFEDLIVFRGVLDILYIRIIFINADNVGSSRERRMSISYFPVEGEHSSHDFAVLFVAPDMRRQIRGMR